MNHMAIFTRRQNGPLDLFLEVIRRRRRSHELMNKCFAENIKTGEQEQNNAPKDMTMEKEIEEVNKI